MQIRRAAVLAIVFLPVVTAAQQVPPAPSGPPTVEKSERDDVIDVLATKLRAGYVLSDAVGRIIQALRSANSAGEYDGKAPREFADAVGRTLRNASGDKHFAVFYEPAAAAPPETATPSEPRERLNFGFGKLERLRGNVGYLELVNFSNLRQQSAETASALLSTLANFDAIIVDLRRNGGGHGPMMAFIATTGGGAHSSRGPQRLTQSFTAIVPAGRSISPITKTNWEGTGVTPDIKTPADAALGVAHLHALRSLLEKETDRQWKQTLQQIADDLARSASAPVPER